MFKARRSRPTGRQRKIPQATPAEDGKIPATYSQSPRQRLEDQPRKKQKLSLSPAATKAGNFWLQRFGSIVLLAVIVASLVNIMTLSSNAKILPLTSSDTTFLHNTSVYQAAADKLLAASALNHNKLTINTAKISQQLLNMFPELASANITLPLLAHRPIIYVAASQPALILNTNGGSYILGANGKALLSMDNLPAGDRINVPTVTDQSGLDIQLNKPALTPANVEFILTVAGQLNAKHLDISALTLPAQTSELDVRIAGQLYFVKFNLAETDARQQVGTFLAVLANLQGKGVTPSQYIDVRVDGRAYYK